jgi:molybdopterin-guanine dinucleotide biosynthesis protein B
MSDVTIEVNGKKLDLNPFTKNMIESTIRGLLSPLRGYEEGEITLIIKNGGDTEI